jgi:hypothetical protein
MPRERVGNGTNNGPPLGARSGAIVLRKLTAINCSRLRSPNISARRAALAGFFLSRGQRSLFREPVPAEGSQAFLMSGARFPAFVPNSDAGMHCELHRQHLPTQSSSPTVGSQSRAAPGQPEAGGGALFLRRPSQLEA